MQQGLRMPFLGHVHCGEPGEPTDEQRVLGRVSALACVIWKQMIFMPIFWLERWSIRELARTQLLVDGGHAYILSFCRMHVAHRP